MIKEPVHVTEDAFHRIQTPRPDNPESDENLANAAQLAIWACNGALRGHVQATVRDGRATLTGLVTTEEERRQAEAAVRALGEEFRAVTNRIELVGERADTPMAEPSAPEAVEGHAMVYVSRFCGLDSSSLTAAINDAVGVLDRLFAGEGLTPPGEAIVVYRNRLAESVVVDVGYAVAAAPEAMPGEQFNVGRSPEGQMIWLLPATGVHGVFEAHDRLVRHAHAAGLVPGSYAWQRISRTGEHRDADRHATPLYLPVS